MPKLSHDKIRDRISRDSFYGITLDTCIFRRYDYDFSHPLLTAMDQFQHSQINVLISEIVACEVRNHLAENARKAQRSLNDALEKQVKRWWLKTSTRSLTSKLALSDDPKVLSDHQFSHYKRAVNLNIVPAVSSIESTNELLRRYFNFQSPFGDIKHRKNEFPDAFALLSLELLAKEQGNLILCVSTDNEWEKYCNESDHLVCVGDLGHTLSYFNESGRIPADNVVAALQSGDKSIMKFIQLIHDELESRVDTLDFHVDASPAYLFEVDSKHVELDHVDFSSASDPGIIKVTKHEVTFSIVFDAYVKFFAIFKVYVTGGFDKSISILDDQLGTQEGKIKTRLVITTSIGRDSEPVLDVIEWSKNILKIDFDEVEPFSREDSTDEKY